MLIKFESKQAAPFHMQSEVALNLLSMIGQSGKLEGSISGPALESALNNLSKALSEQAVAEVDPEDEEDEREYVSIHARAAPLKAMLLHAKELESYVMWRPD